MTAEQEQMLKRIEKLLARRHDPSFETELSVFLAPFLQRVIHLRLPNYPLIPVGEETMDVVQEVWLRVRRALKAVEFQSPQHFLNTVNQHIRWTLLEMTQKRRFDQIPDCMTGSAVLPDRRPGATNDEDWEAFWKAFDRLEEPLRLALELSYIEGLTQWQVAQVLGVDERTIRRRLHRGRIALAHAVSGTLQVAEKG